ncbi:MAG: L,D-transpeptidase family protein [Candidatus Omnitrophota bacterium]
MIRNIAIFVLVVVIAATMGAFVLTMKQRKAKEDSLDKMHLAEAMLESQDYNGAVKNLLPVVERGKRFEQADKALYLLAQTYEKLGAKEAIGLWRRIADEFPESVYRLEARMNLANSLINEKPDEARSIYEDASKSSDDKIKEQALAGIAISYATGDPEKALSLFYQIVDAKPKNPNVEAAAKDFITKINSERLWSPRLDEFCQLYSVQPGDSADKISDIYKTTSAFLCEANNFKPNALKPGRQIKVPKEPFHIVVDKSNCRLNLLSQSGRFIKWYPVGIGTESYKTPAGEYVITTKQIDPKWYKPEGGVAEPGDPENALGVRWMGISTTDGQKTGLGIHGTNAPETIGFRKSAGCIRMYNEAVIELYKIVTYGTPVTIVEDME